MKRSEDEERFSVLSMRIRFGGPHFSKCACSERKFVLVDLLVLRFKDGAYYCYCAYVLRILRYSDFLSVMLTNTGIFLRGLKLSGESRS